MDLIQELKDNEKPFGLMPKDMQAKAREIKVHNFNYYLGNNSGDWSEDDEVDNVFHYYRTYHLRPDYQEEPEVKVEKCRIFEDELHSLVYKRVTEGELNIMSAPIIPDFIGFLYKDERIEGGSRVSPTPRLVMAPTGYTFVNMSEDDLGTYEVLTPTHVLFRKGKYDR